MILDEFDAVLIPLFTYQFPEFFTIWLFYSAALSRGHIQVVPRTTCFPCCLHFTCSLHVISSLQELESLIFSNKKDYKTKIRIRYIWQGGGATRRKLHSSGPLTRKVNAGTWSRAGSRSTFGSLAAYLSHECMCIPMPWLWDHYLVSARFCIISFILLNSCGVASYLGVD